MPLTQVFDEMIREATFFVDDRFALPLYILWPRRYFQISTNVAEHSSRNIVPTITTPRCHLVEEADGKPSDCFI